jgi:hypothetical protein
MMTDVAGGKSMEDIIAQIIAETVWGVSENEKWEAKVDTVSVSNPKPDEWISYYKHLEKLYGKFQKGKAEKVEALRKFVIEGGPGYRFRSIFEELVAKMTVPEEHRQQLGKYHIIIPAFFNLIEHLVKRGRKFHLIFRTFGQDIENITETWNSFCDGKNPMYPHIRYNGTVDSLPNLKIKIPDSYGAFYRHGNKSDEVHLVLKSIQQKEFDKGLDHIKALGFEVVDSYKHIHETILKRSKEFQVLALRDYYPWWAKNDERYDTGKLVFIDNENATHTIFFDDNIHIDEYLMDKNLIVDARHAHTFEPIDPTTIINSNLVTANPIDIIRNPNWFIESLQVCEENFKKLKQ